VKSVGNSAILSFSFVGKKALLGWYLLCLVGERRLLLSFMKMNTEKKTLLPQQNVLLLWPQQTRIAVVTISIVTTTTT